MVQFSHYRTRFDIATSPPFHDKRTVQNFYDEEGAREMASEAFSNNDMNGLVIECAWYQLACPTFKVYPGMLECLLHTNIEIPVEQVHLPFPVFSIQLPLPLLRESGESPGLRGVMLTAVPFKQDDGTEESLQVWTDYEERRGGNTICTAFPLRPGSTVEESLMELIGSAPPGDCPYWPSIDATRNAVRIAMGVALMATANVQDEGGNSLVVEDAPSLVEKLRLAKRKKKMGAKVSPKGFAVGKDIVLAKEPVKSLGKATGRGEKLQYGHIRSGFLRLQPFGPRKMGMYKIIFIAPTRVRPDLPLKPKLTERAVKRPEVIVASENGQSGPTPTRGAANS